MMKIIEFILQEMLVDSFFVHNPFSVIATVIGLLQFTQMLQLDYLVVSGNHKLLQKLLKPIL